MSSGPPDDVRVAERMREALRLGREQAARRRAGEPVVPEGAGRRLRRVAALRELGRRLGAAGRPPGAASNPGAE